MRDLMTPGTIAQKQQGSTPPMWGGGGGGGWNQWLYGRGQASPPTMDLKASAPRPTGYVEGAPGGMPGGFDGGSSILFDLFKMFQPGGYGKRPMVSPIMASLAQLLGRR